MSDNGKRTRKKPKEVTEPERILAALQAKVDKPSATFNPQQHKDETRASIALYFVKGFFLMIGITLVGIPLYNLAAKPAGVDAVPLKDILPAISGLISGPLGFVIGHYFKSDR